MVIFLRRLTQLAAFLLFAFLLVQLAGVAGSWMSPYLPPDSILRLSPFAALATMLGAKAFIARYVPALVLLGLAILLGRFFCGWVCPLGSTIDTADNVLVHARKGREPTLYDGRRLKYYLLAFLLIGAVLGISVAGWFDPLSIATRSFGLVVVPYVVWLSGGASPVLRDLGGRSFGEEWDRGSRLLLADSSVPTYQQHAVFLLLLVLILAVGVWYRRYWCRNLCPLGGLLGLFSLRPLCRRSVSDACISCGKCERTCPMGCITDEGKGTLAGECILCLKCQEACPKDAIRFWRRQPAEQDTAVDLTKRGFIGTLAATAVGLPLLRINVPRTRQKDRMSLLRPPGALPEDDFLARCVRCGECMRACPTRALQPSALEGGLEGLWSPRLVPRIGYCVYPCTLCGQVCPSQAIQRLTVERKQALSLGKARFNVSRCIPWVGHARFREGLTEWKDTNCGTCEEACPVPTKAIRFNRFVGKVGDKTIHIDRPYVVEELCVGCGFCENVCPVAGEAAIVVEGPAGAATVAGEEAVAGGAPSALDYRKVFAAKIEGWSLAGAPKVYAGKAIYDYIDGAAEPYLTYAFESVAAAKYVSVPPASRRPPGAAGTAAVQGEKAITADLWLFGSPAEAFGAYSRDCSAAASAPESVGDAAGIGEGEVWVWRGACYLHLTSAGAAPASRGELLALAKAIEPLLPDGGAKRPPIVAALPEAALVPYSVDYFHADLAAPDDLPTDLRGPDGFAINDKAPSAFARYNSGGKPAYSLVAVEYESAAAAQDALGRCVRLLGSAGKEAAAAEGVKVFQGQASGFSAVVAQGRRAGAVLRAKSAEAAMKAALELRGALGK